MRQRFLAYSSAVEHVGVFTAKKRTFVISNMHEKAEGVILRGTYKLAAERGARRHGTPAPSLTINTAYIPDVYH